MQWKPLQTGIKVKCPMIIVQLVEIHSVLWEVKLEYNYTPSIIQTKFVFIDATLFFILGVSCGSPPNMTNTWPVSTNGTNYKDVANYRCLPGYNPDRNKTIQCQGNRRWSQLSSCASMYEANDLLAKWILKKQGLDLILHAWFQHIPAVNW